MKKTSYYYLGGLFAMMLSLLACKKEAGSSSVSVKMKDAPGDYQQVNVEVLRVDLHYSNGQNGTDGWVSLATNAGIYDLLTLQNDITTVLSNPNIIPAGHVNQMRLILGTSNSLMIDSTLYYMSTPSAQNTGLKINVDADFQPNQTYELLIDFDAGQSIVEQGNGSYSLKPVIKLESIVEL